MGLTWSGVWAGEYGSESTGEPWGFLGKSRTSRPASCQQAVAQQPARDPCAAGTQLPPWVWGCL